MKTNMKCVRIFADKHLENIRSMFKTLYEDEMLTDCTLICKGGSVKAHKIILASCSSYFRKIFSDHASDKAIFIMFGITFDQLKDLIALIYKGCIDIPSDHLSSVFDLAEELEVSGILVEGKDTNYSQHGQEENRQKLQAHKRPSIHNPMETESSASKIAKPLENDKIADVSNVVPKPADHVDSISVKPITEMFNDQLLGHAVDEQTTLSTWARTERKFQCNQCPSSFKRASHLSRHQLVHTGERPFPCNQCDKAFSRHDKLKNHVHKTHELDLLNEALPPDSLYTIGHVQILTPEQTMIEMSGTIETATDDYKPYFSGEEEEDQEDDDDDDDDASTSNSLDFKPPIRRKSRGRPRKYPQKINIGPKRPRGRPRKFPLRDPIPKVKRPVGRPRIRPLDFDQDIKVNIKNPPDENEIPKSTIITNVAVEPNIMEPLVRIKTESNIQEPQDPTEPDIHILQAATEPDIQIIEGPVNIPITQGVPQNPGVETSIEKIVKQEHISFFENIGLFENSSTIAKIGECTISVSSSSGINALSTDKSMGID